MTEKRRPLTRKQVMFLCIEQAGRCACGCGERLDPMGEGVIDEHFNPLGLTGTNATENRKLFRKPCAVYKTKADVKRIAKAKRQGGIESGQWAKRMKRGHGSIASRPNAWPKGKTKWPSRPFEKREK